MSQTEYITVYTINPPDGSRFNFRLRIIDTPGFGDTRGIPRDEQLVKQIRHLFDGNGSEIHFLDAICFIAKAPDARLTPTQRYIFEQILLLFGKDVEANICPLITFADGREPQVLHALGTYVPCRNWFGFNNSALFAENVSKEGDDLSSFFWEMGKKSYHKFFSYLQNLSPKSLTQTKEVLLTRHKLEMTITELQREVKLGVQKVGELEAEIKIFKEKEEAFLENKSFKYTVMETIPFKNEIQDGQSTTNCDFCKKTCHFPCTECKGDDKSKCTAMDWKGNCLQCMKRCTHSVHKNDKFTYSFVQVPVVRSRGDMEKKYKRSGEEVITHGEILARMYSELSAREDSIKKKMEMVTELNNTLRRIALKPTQVSLLNYIDILMAQERKGSNPGFQERLKVLQDIKEKAEFHQTVLARKPSVGLFDDKLNKVKDVALGTVRNLEDKTKTKRN